MVDVSAGSNLIAPGEFRIGAAISKALSILWRHLGRFLLIAGVAAIPNLVTYWNQGAFIEALRHQIMLGESITTFQPPKSGGAGANLISLLGSIFAIFAQATIFHNTFAILTGRDAGILGSLRAGVARFWPMIGLGIVLSVGVVLGFMLLFVPGVILVTMWYAAFPACVIERLGPIRSLSRSAELTKGHRWKLFGMLVLLLIAGLVVGGLTIGILFAISGGAFVVGEYALQALATAITTILTTVVYHDLRVAREGMNSDTVAAVFE